MDFNPSKISSKEVTHSDQVRYGNYLYTQYTGFFGVSDNGDGQEIRPLSYTSAYTLSIPVDRLKQVLKFSANGDVRYYLNSVLVTTCGRLVAADGHTIEVAMLNTSAPDKDLILPATALKTLAKQFKKGSFIQLVVFEVCGKAYLQCQFDNGTYQFETIDATYPHWERIFPAQETPFKRVYVPAESIKSCLENAKEQDRHDAFMKKGKELFRAVRICDSGVGLLPTDYNNWPSYPVVGEVTEVVVYLNLKYLSRFLDGKQDVVLDIRDGSAVVVVNGSGIIMIISPPKNKAA